jgi:glucosylceramidase
MPKTLRIAMAVGLVLAGVAGCGGSSNGESSRDAASGRDIAGEVCEKASSCGALSGISAEGCKNTVNGSLGSMTSDARSDAEKALDACLETADCENVGTCIEGALGGGTTGTGGRSAGGSGGSSAGGSGGSAAGGSSGNSGGGGAGGSGGGSGATSSGGAGGGAGAGNGGAGSGGSAAGGSAGSSGGGRGGTTVVGSGGTSLSGSGGNAGGTSGAGGQAGGTGGATAVSAEPEVMTSAQNAYWVKGQVTKVTSGTADVNVDKNTTYQRWDGFGGTFNEMGWDALSVVSSEIPNALKYLFHATEGANFVYGRIPLGASDYSMSWYTLDDLPSGTANDYTMDKFSIARDKEKLIPFIKEALKVRPDIYLWASPWVVPAWMKNGSAMKSDAQTMDAHALYMARFVEEYAKEGLKIQAIHPQNEPGYGRVSWTQSQLIDFMKKNLGPKLAERNLTTEVWCGTMSKADNGGYDMAIALATAKDADAMKFVKGFGLQWNLHDAVATLAATKVPVMQTEHRCGNYNFASPYWDQTRYSSSKAQNDHLYGEESWQIIRDWIVSGVNSYSAWNMVLDTVGKSLDGWPQDALLVVDRTAKKLIVTPAYYVFRHFSYYIAVGATRVGATAGTDAYKGANTTKYGPGKATYDAVNAFAFKNPDGTIVVQLYNKAASSTKTTVGVGSALSQSLYQFDVPGHGWATLRVAP